MASPQRENGFTAIANELLEVILKADFTSRELKILFTVIRFTYGYQVKEAELAVRFISKATGIVFNHVSEVVNKLQAKNVLILSESVSHNQRRVIKLNKDYESWVLVSSRIRNSSSKSNGTVPEKGTAPVPKTGTNKDNSKENLKIWFEDLWRTFDIELGKKGSKQDAFNRFIKLNPHQKTFDLIKEALVNQIFYKRSLHNEGKFFESFPHVFRWLRDKRWEDEILANNSKNSIKNNNEVVYT